MKTTKKGLQQSVWTVTGVVLFILLLSILSFLSTSPNDLIHEVKGELLKYSEDNIKPSYGLLLSFQILVLIVTTILIRYMEESNNLFRKKSVLTLTFPPLILVGSGSWFIYSPVSLFSLFFILQLIFLLREYRSKRPERSLFYMGFTLSLFSMLDVDFLYILLCVWIAVWLQKTLNIRTILVSLLGVLIPYLYYFGTDLYLNGDVSFSLNHLSELLNSFSDSIWNTQSPFDIAYWTAIGVLTFISLLNFFHYSYKEKQRVRNSLLILFWFWISSVLMMVFKSGEFAYFESLFLVISSIFISHFFTVANNRLSIVLFYVSFLFLIIYPLIRILWKV